MCDRNNEELKRNNSTQIKYHGEEKTKYIKERRWKKKSVKNMRRIMSTTWHECQISHKINSNKRIHEIITRFSIRKIRDKKI